MEAAVTTDHCGRDPSASQFGRRCSIQSRVRDRPDRSGGMSSARSAKPIGSIQNPKIGRNPSIPPKASNSPIGNLSQRTDGRRRKRTIERTRFGNRSMSRSSRQSSTRIACAWTRLGCDSICTRLSLSPRLKMSKYEWLVPLSLQTAVDQLRLWKQRRNQPQQSEHLRFFRMEPAIRCGDAIRYSNYVASQ